MKEKQQPVNTTQAERKLILDLLCDETARRRRNYAGALPFDQTDEYEEMSRIVMKFNSAEDSHWVSLKREPVQLKGIEEFLHQKIDAAFEEAADAFGLETGDMPPNDELDMAIATHEIAEIMQNWIDRNMRVSQ